MTDSATERQCVLKFSPTLGLTWHNDIAVLTNLVVASEDSAAENRELLARVKTFLTIMSLTLHGLEAETTPEEDAAAINADQFIESDRWTKPDDVQG